MSENTKGFKIKNKNTLPSGPRLNPMILFDSLREMIFFKELKLRFDIMLKYSKQNTCETQM